MDFQETIEPEILDTKTEKIINSSKSFIALSDKNNEYTLLFENKIKLLNITSKISGNNYKHNFIYKNNFSLHDIQKVKWFLAYNSIDDC